jgi:hypothetical protein
MGGKAFDRNLEKIEYLRQCLCRRVNGKREMLYSKEVYEVSKRLDKLIVKQMSSQLNK